jgi:DNA-binding transcriptional LysR family regulator
MCASSAASTDSRPAPLWVEFMAQPPKVTLDITLADRVVDLVEEGFDMAVRLTCSAARSHG